MCEHESHEEESDNSGSAFLVGMALGGILSLVVAYFALKHGTPFSVHGY